MVERCVKMTGALYDKTIVFTSLVYFEVKKYVKLHSLYMKEQIT